MSKKSLKPVVCVQGVPEAPQCGFSNQVCRILDAYGAHRLLACNYYMHILQLHCKSMQYYMLCMSAGVDYGSRNVLADPDLRSGIKEFSSWPTVPQVDHAVFRQLCFPLPHFCTAYGFKCVQRSLAAWCFKHNPQL